MTSLAKRKTRLQFTTSDCVRYRGKLREIVVKATEYTAQVRLKGTKHNYELSWAGIWNLAVKIAVEKQRRRETSTQTRNYQKPKEEINHGSQFFSRCYSRHNLQFLAGRVHHIARIEWSA